MGRREKRMRRTWKEGGRRSGARRCEFKTRTQLTGGLGTRGTYVSPAMADMRVAVEARQTTRLADHSIFPS
eukprot:1426069-Pyramimonas_sp.AAC.1